jgi:hypothetical protein
MQKMKKVAQKGPSVVYDDGENWILKSLNSDDVVVNKKKRPYYLDALLEKWGFRAIASGEE